MSRSILGMPMFCEPCPFHQGEEQPHSELRVVSFIYASWSDEGKVENCGLGERGEMRKSVSLR